MTSMPHLPAMEWDHNDQMREVDLGGGGTAYYTYDAAGQRVRKVWEHSGLVEERIYLGGWEVYRKRDSLGNLLVERETLHGMDGTRRVVLVETKTVDVDAGGAFTVVSRYRFQLDNHLGSASLEVDESGLVIGYEEYHPYGMTAYASGRGGAEVSGKRYRYTGKERDEETGLYYHGARHMAPWLGRWTSADPAGLVDGPGLYTYVRNSPIRLKDPTGKESLAKPNPMKSASQEYKAEEKYYTKQRQSLMAAEQAWTAEADRLRESPILDRSGFPQAGSHGQSLWFDAAAESAKYHTAVGQLDDQWARVETAYRSFAFPQGSIGPDSSVEASKSQNLDEFNASMDAIKHSPLTAIVLSAYSVAAMVKNRSAGTLTATQQDTFKRILVVGSGLEGIAMVAAPVAIVATKKAMPALRSAALRPLWLFMGAGGLGGGADMPSEGPAVQDLVPSLRPDRPLGSTRHPLDGTPKALHPQVFSILEDLAQARAGRADMATSARLLARTPHELTGDWRGWTSLDIAGRENSLRLIFKEQSDRIDWKVVDTHSR